MRFLSLGALVFLVIGCGDDKPPKTAEDKVAMAPPEAAPVASPPAAPAPAPAPEPPAKRRPYELVNLCPKPVTLLFDKGGSEDPKAASVSRQNLAGNGRIDEPPRDKDGNQVIWLIVRDEPLVRVRVSRGTKRIEVGTSCDTLEMH